MNAVSSKRISISFLNPPLSWIPICGFIFVLTVLIIFGAGGFLRLFFIAGSFAVGVILYFQKTHLYLGFAWWMWFLTPLVRRLIDLQAGWEDPNIVLLAPFLVTAVSFLTFIRKLPTCKTGSGLLFIFPMAAVIYALLVGLVKGQDDIETVIIPFLNWFAPIAFGFHIFSDWRDYPNLRQNTQRVFLWCVLITGFYGILQFLVAPVWDQFWMENAPINTIGEPEPFEIRVFSTMNSPGPFASVLTAGLLLLLNCIGPLVIPAYTFGYLSFLLSSARGAWGGWIIGLMCLVTNLKPKLQMRLVLVATVVMLFVIPLTFVEPFSEVIYSRFDTITNLQGDVSLWERQNRYNRILGLALVQWLGQGMGGNPEAHIDSGILDMLFTLGWFGTIPYFFAIVALIMGTFQYFETRFDTFMATSRAIVLGTFAQLGLATPTVGLTGVVFWGFLALTLAGHQYHLHQTALQERDLSVEKANKLEKV